MAVSLLPGLGGKIYELLDLDTGRDWLWKNPHIPLRQPRTGLDYERELDSGGWDEILFSVKPCSVDLSGGGRLAVDDHGALVGRPWEVDHAGVNGEGAAVCALETTGSRPAFGFRRTVTLDAEQPRMTLDYALQNTGATGWPWMWCAHPLLAVQAGMHIELQAGLPMHVAGGVRGVSRWPLMEPVAGGTDLADIFAGPVRSEPFAAKVFVISSGEVGIRAADGGKALRLHYDAGKLPWLGLWINRYGWSGCGSETYLNLGVEPGTAPCDTLTEALADGSARYLRPGESSCWSLELALAAG